MKALCLRLRLAGMDAYPRNVLGDEIDCEDMQFKLGGSDRPGCAIDGDGLDVGGSEVRGRRRSLLPPIGNVA
ncbi:MAG: hypothetical protein WBG92_19225 [Thiohalocapsa sp.]